jgi:predicted permease
VRHLLSDLRFALRAWQHQPGFTTVAILSMALGIGANTAIFTLVDQVLLRLLPVRNPQQLVQLTMEGVHFGSNWGDGSELSYPMYTDFRDHTQVFSGVFGRFGYNFHVSYLGRTERVRGEIVTGTYFPVLGVGAALGRVISPDDDRLKDGHPVAVLTYAYWRTRFASDPTVVGRKTIINGQPFTIIGVAQAGFDGVDIGEATQVFVPMMMKAKVTPGWDALDDRLYRWVRVFGRLKPGVTKAQAEVALKPYFASLLQLDLSAPGFSAGSAQTRQRYVQNRLVLTSGSQGRSSFRREMTTPLWALMAIAGAVLVIACANVANLLLARAAGRQREMAMRLALGAGRGRLVQQLLVESVLLALAGGIGGLAIAVAGAPVVLGFFVDSSAPPVVSTLPDARILAFTFAVATLTGVLFGLAPAFQSTRTDLASTLKSESGSVVGGRARLRQALVASQVAVSLLLLVGAALFIRTLANLAAVDIGIKTTNLLAFEVDPSRNGYSVLRTKQFSKQLLERVHTSPGVQSASLATMRILEGNQWSSSVAIEGYQFKPDESTSQLCNAVSPGYFRTLGIPLVAGRDFSDRDEYVDVGSEDRTFRVAIASQQFVKRYFGHTNPIGRRIGFGDASNPGTKTPIQIVGVVGDSKYTDVRSETPRELFFPFLEANDPGGFVVYVRTTRDAATAFESMRRTVQQLDSNLPVSDMRTVDAQVDRSLSSERLLATMSSIFGVLATTLAVVGLYGVMAYAVTRRTREIGIRMALGARGIDVGWLVMKETLVITMVGAAMGVPATWWLSRYVESQLYGVKPMDALAVAMAIFALAIAATIAGLAPTRRAVRVEPITALRYE